MNRTPTRTAVSRRDLLWASLALPIVGMLPKSVSAAVAPPPQISEDDLREDARVAWQFFKPNDKYMPGMVPATTSHPVLAMWDTGSLILAYVAARNLDLIDQKDFNDRIEGVVAFLKKAVYRWKGADLPNFQTYVTTGKSYEDGYNSTDAARLLVGLKVLQKRGGKDFGIDELVSGWDIASTVRDGRIHDVIKGKLVPYELSMYSNYLSRAYNLWDIKHEPIMDPRPLRDEAAKKAFLASAADAGSIGTEPHVTEAVELGYSEPAEFLAGILYDAQVKRFEDTGHLTCVSEAPIDRAPWFIYQGYQLTGNGTQGKWAISGAGSSPQWRTAKFADKIRMVVSGSAYLWYAARPDDYTARLCAYVSEYGKTKDEGFSPGIYERGNRADEYPDINNNALILESLAFIAKGRTPLLEGVS